MSHNIMEYESDYVNSSGSISDCEIGDEIDSDVSLYTDGANQPELCVICLSPVLGETKIVCRNKHIMHKNCDFNGECLVCECPECFDERERLCQTCFEPVPEPIKACRNDHLFHEECLYNLLFENPRATCPLCREVMNPQRLPSPRRVLGLSLARSTPLFAGEDHVSSRFRRTQPPPTSTSERFRHSLARDKPLLGFSTKLLRGPCSSKRSRLSKRLSDSSSDDETFKKI